MIASARRQAWRTRILGPNPRVAEAWRRFPDLFLLAGPFLAVLGPTASDIWLSVVAAAFCAASVRAGDFRWARAVWFRFAIAFWLWLLLSALLSEWPRANLTNVLLWVRFPLFAAALAVWLGNSAPRRERLLLACLAGTLFFAAALFLERVQNPDAARLFGTWNQGPKAGIYMLGIGTPALMGLLRAFVVRPATRIWSGPLTLAILAATFATGDVFASLLVVFGLGIFVLLARLVTPGLIGLLALAAVAVVGVLQTNDGLAARFTTQVATRLPWLPSSDYYSSWFGGLEAGRSQPLFGIGPGAFKDFCRSGRMDGVLEASARPQCLQHPHQIYIHAFAETGVPGLVLFLGMAGGILLVLARAFRRAADAGTAAALAVGLMLFWPVSTYQDLFGQHRNFFTWFLLGGALAVARAQGQAPRGGDIPA